MKHGSDHPFQMGKRKFLKATDPKRLERQAHEIYTSIKKAIPKIPFKTEVDSEEVLFFKGYNGIKAIYEEMLNSSNEGDEFLIIGARGGEDVSIKTYRNFFKNYNDRRIKKRIIQKIIMDLELKKQIGDYYNNLKFTRVKYLDQKTLAPIVIFPKAIGIVQWKEEPTLYLMKGKLIVESFKQYFDVLWKAAKFL